MPDFSLKRPQFQLPKPFLLKIGGYLFDLSRPKVMGIINLTTDSFFEGSRTSGKEEILEKVSKMISEGVDFLDIGAVSTRPGADFISENEELQRLISVIIAIRALYKDVLISVDTFRSSVAESSIKAGANMINDISGGLFDHKMFKTIARLDVPYILMHNRGDWHSMHAKNVYGNISVEIIKETQDKLIKARHAGINDIIVDPGFGFSKNVEQNFRLLKNLNALDILDCPILVGLSRKSMIYKTLGGSPNEALNGSTALHMASLMQGASILRVHDVKEAKETIQLFEKLCLQE